MTSLLDYDEVLETVSVKINLYPFQLFDNPNRSEENSTDDAVERFVGSFKSILDIEEYITRQQFYQDRFLGNNTYDIAVTGLNGSVTFIAWYEILGGDLNFGFIRGIKNERQKDICC